jgi:hypothetical protein
MTSEDGLDDDNLAKGVLDAYQSFGFLAMWRRTEAYHHSNNREREAFEGALSQSLTIARSRGIRMLGNYDCRWSTEWEYFTFWQAPNLKVMEETMENLESCRTFLYFDSRHVIGRVEPNFRFGRHLASE